jgi:hypothetical protein
LGASEPLGLNRAKILASKKRFNQEGKKYRSFENPLAKPGKSIDICKIL